MSRLETLFFKVSVLRVWSLGYTSAPWSLRKWACLICIFYFSNGTISASKYAKSNPISYLPNNVYSVILWRPMVVKSQRIY